MKIDIKLIERRILRPLYDDFERDLSKHSHGFVKKRSKIENMISFLKEIHKALEDTKQEDLGITQNFDVTAHFGLLQKNVRKSAGGR